ncbi:MAG: AMIN domain-containing protein [Oligoflexia bacterium]|nr:AMIN domain-containing protein [Oligoflexia bacterium]
MRRLLEAARQNLTATLLLCVTWAGLTNLAMAAPQTLDIQGMKVSVDAASNAALLIQIPIPTGAKAQTLSLESPARLVVDVTGISKKFRSESRPFSSGALSAVRLGAHPDKVRLVFDFTSASISTTEKQVKNVLNITVRTTDASEANLPAPTPLPSSPAATPTSEPQLPQPSKLSPIPKATEVPINTSTPTKVPTTAPTATPTSVPNTPTPAATPTPISIAPTATPFIAKTKIPAVVEPTKADNVAASVTTSGLRVSGLSFDYAEPDRVPVLKVELSSKLEFRLSKKDDKTFKIAIPNCRIASKSLSLPIFPPQDFVGLTFAMAQQFGDDVEITIGVERGIRVSALPRDNQIWVRSLNR